MHVAVTIAAAMVVVGGIGCDPGGTKGRPAGMSVWEGSSWHAFWRSDRAPSRWGGPDSSLIRSLAWHRPTPGLEWATTRISCAAPAGRAEIIVVRLDPRAVSLTLTMDLTRAKMLPAWSIDRTPGDAVLAVNAGQFVNTMPWGWVVIDGQQRLRPGYGPLASAIAIDAAGNVRWSHGDSLADVAGVVTGFQSYPTLLAGGGVVPEALRAPGGAVNLTHRDARLAFGQARDGRLLIAMTRFDAIGKAAAQVPLGPTTPEMAAIMGALGASDAVALDGGISAQMLLRDPARKVPLEWRGLRKVPLALIARARGGQDGAGLSGTAW